jgi:hypothetical protein
MASKNAMAILFTLLMGIVFTLLMGIVFTWFMDMGFSTMFSNCSKKSEARLWL